MTLSIKRSSPIQVNGIDFRWTVSARALSSTEKVLLVVQSINNGQRLVVTVPCRDRYLRMNVPTPEFNYESITPSLVRKIMLAAVDVGWVPDQPGAEKRFELQPDETLLPL